VKPTGSPWLAAGAVAACAVLALSYLGVGRALRYAALGFSSDTRLPWLLPLAVAGAFANERLVRGWLYEKLREKLAPGLAAPCVAMLGAVVPAAARLAVFGRKGAAPALVAGHTFLVGSLLGLGLAWLALGTGSTVPGGAALAAVWAAKLGINVGSVGPTVPLLELCASGLAAAGVAAVLWSPLAPHRDKVMGTA
jgi:hypothetical protein